MKRKVAGVINIDNREDVQMAIRPIFLPHEDAFALLSNSEYNWTVTRFVSGAAVEFEANNAPADIQDNLKVLVIDVNLLDQDAVQNFISNSVTSANSVQLDFQQWSPHGYMIGDILVDGNRMSELLIQNNLATS